jgi:site-specific DNA-methyltransferase (adenine-specific)
MIEYFNEDCLIGMARYPDKYFELAIVDPPYGLDRYKKNDGGNSKKIRCFGDKDKNWNNEKPSDKYFEELFRISKSQIIWGANNFTLPTSEYFIIWDKQQMMPSFARCEMAWTNCKVPAKIYAYRSQDGDRIHPTQKPVALYKWLLTNYAKEGDLILDTHVGSASSLIACYDLGFDAVGFELDEDYYKASKQRLENHQKQISLFDYLCPHGRCLF